mmetsp:Transcript_10762/g.21599  ORF Transcript_10762/g.21599 Transcript_10762/m.21599 type:complete len:389 (-) Transcript_10762:11-1177(-)
MGVERLFTIDSRYLGIGTIAVAWHPQGSLVATVGPNNVIQIFDRRGHVFDQLVGPVPGEVICMQWDYSGTTLAVLTAASGGRLALWRLGERCYEVVHTKWRELTGLQWATLGSVLGLLGGRGRVAVYNTETRVMREVIPPQPSFAVMDRIVQSEWEKIDDERSAWALACPDRRIVVIDDRGSLLDELGGSPRLRLRPTEVQLCNISGMNRLAGLVLSACLESQTILLASVFGCFESTTKSFEINFPDQCGTILCHQWRRETGELVVSFTNGTIAIVPVLAGPDLSFRRSRLAFSVVEGSIRSAASSSRGWIAVDTGEEIRIVADHWGSVMISPVLVIHYDRGTELENLAWAGDGTILSFSIAASGSFHCFKIQESMFDFRRFLRSLPL